MELYSPYLSLYFWLVQQPIYLCPFMASTRKQVKAVNKTLAWCFFVLTAGLCTSERGEWMPKHNIVLVGPFGPMIG